MNLEVTPELVEVNKTLQRFSSSTELSTELSRELSTTEIATEYLEEKLRNNP